MPAAAVIPAPIVYFKVVAVKTLVVNQCNIGYFRSNQPRITFMS